MCIRDRERGHAGRCSYSRAVGSATGAHAHPGAGSAVTRDGDRGEEGPMTFGVIAFIVAILASVMLHEAGHFAMAKAFGMKVTQFFVGFGPTLWSVRRGETEYGVGPKPTKNW